MHVYAILCMSALVWVSCQRNALNEWHTYVQKTLYDCLEMHSNSEDLVNQCGIATKCYKGTWAARIIAKTLMKKPNQPNHYFVTPYTHIQHSYRGVQSTTIHITVHRVFKVNLTLIRLDIQRSLSGCSHGKLTVSCFMFSLQFH